MYSTLINNEIGLPPDYDVHAHPPPEAEIEFVPNLSQIEAEAELLANICTGTPSPLPPSPGTNSTDCYAEWDPSPSPAQEAQYAAPIRQSGGHQEPPILTFTNMHGTQVSIQCPIPGPPTEHPEPATHQTTSQGRDQDQRSSLHVLFQNVHHISQQTTTVLETHQKTHDIFVVLEPWYGRLRAMGPDTQFAMAAWGTQVGSPDGSYEDDDCHNYDQLPTVLPPGCTRCQSSAMKPARVHGHPTHQEPTPSLTRLQQVLALQHTVAPQLDALRNADQCTHCHLRQQTDLKGRP